LRRSNLHLQFWYDRAIFLAATDRLATFYGGNEVALTVSERLALLRTLNPTSSGLKFYFIFSRRGLEGTLNVNFNSTPGLAVISAL